MFILSNHKKFAHSGLTLVELLVVAPIIMLVIGVAMTAIISITGQSMVQLSAGNLTYDLGNSLSSIKKDLKTTNSFLATNSVALSSVNGLNDDTTAFVNVNTSGQSLILKAVATTSNPDDSDLSVVYLSGSPNSCNSSLLSQNTPLYINIVYFVKNGTLWRRIIMPSSYSACSTPWQQPSCSDGISGSICKAKDADLVDNVTSFSINYLDKNQTSLPVASTLGTSDSYRQMYLSRARFINVSITAQKTTASTTFNKTTSMIISLQN